MNIYLANTSRGVIDKLIDTDLTKRYFVKWNEKAKKKVIQLCGLTSSKYKNVNARNEILCHLHATELPVDPGEVQRMTNRLGLPPSGSSSLKQFAFFLLSFLCDKLPFPPWEPQPLIKLAPPSKEALIDVTKTICKGRVIQCVEERPWAYDIQESAVRHLWPTRFKVSVQYIVCIVCMY